jgi:hypothetical protein
MKLVSSTAIVFVALSALTYHYIHAWGDMSPEPLELAATAELERPLAYASAARLP